VDAERAVAAHRRAETARVDELRRFDEAIASGSARVIDLRPSPADGNYYQPRELRRPHVKAHLFTLPANLGRNVPLTHGGAHPRASREVIFQRGVARSLDGSTYYEVQEGGTVWRSYLARTWLTESFRQIPGFQILRERQWDPTWLLRHGWTELRDYTVD
jgi:hypothetical protein